MKLVSVLVTLAAILSSVFVIGSLIIWLSGIEYILLPGLNLIVATRVIVLLLLIVTVILVLLAIFTKKRA